jgi:hypothetical protein
LTSALDGGEWSAPGTHWIEGWVAAIIIIVIIIIIIIIIIKEGGQLSQ